MKLEEGKWYTWFHTSHATYHIGKHFNSPDENIVRMSPWLIGGDEYKIIGSFESKFMQDIVEITDLTEISKLLPDGHVDKVTPKSERYITTMKFFEQLKEPERSQAIENYDKSYSCVPDTITEAISHGFDWAKSKQGYKYWYDIHTSIEGNTYFKEPEPEVLVFGKYKIGDIVVSLIDYSSDIKKGGLFIVTKESTKHLLIQSNDWRLATPEEAKVYNSGIKNINDIKPKSLEGRYIKCLKENDWDNGKTKVGDVLKIRKSDSVGDLFIGLECLDNSRLRDGQFELLPIDYTPEPVKEEEPMFKKGDYIVTLINDGDCGKVNYCSKQSVADEYLRPEIDIQGCTHNGNATFTFSDKSGYKWRFGTKEEGEEYERHGKPYNVTNLLSSSYIAKVGDYVEVVDTFNNFFKLGDIVECVAEERFRDRTGIVQVLSPKRYKAVSIGTTLVSNNPSDLITRDVSILSTSTFYGNTPYSYPLTPKEDHHNYSLPVPTNIILKTKSKSIKL